MTVSLIELHLLFKWYCTRVFVLFLFLPILRPLSATEKLHAPVELLIFLHATLHVSVAGLGNFREMWGNVFLTNWYRYLTDKQIVGDDLEKCPNIHYRTFVFCLFIYCFTSRSRIFHLYWDVTIAGEGLQNLDLCSALRAFEQGGIFIVPYILVGGCRDWNINIFVA
jgi:hypothetical protein